MTLGVVLIVTGISIASGLDKALEEKLVAASPAWLTELTTRF
jgi:cytochrome c-type biogenesis protein